MRIDPLKDSHYYFKELPKLRKVTTNKASDEYINTLSDDGFKEALIEVDFGISLEALERIFKII